MFACTANRTPRIVPRSGRFAVRFMVHTAIRPVRSPIRTTEFDLSNGRGVGFGLSERNVNATRKNAKMRSFTMFFSVFPKTKIAENHA